MKRVFVLIIAILIFLCGCAGNQVSDMQQSHSPSGSISNLPSAALDRFPDEKAPVVLFIGNSLTYMSGIPEKFSDISLSKNIDVSVMEVTRPGYSLSHNLSDFKSMSKLKEYITDSDIVILQELGKHQKDTVEAINGFQDLLGSSKQYYFLETEFKKFIGNARDNLKDITFIRSGFAHNQLIYNGTFKYYDLHMPNDPHPNELYGYIAAFTVFCKLNKVKCSDYFSVEDMSKIIGEQSIEGTVTEIKSEVIQGIQQAVDAALEDESV